MVLYFCQKLQKPKSKITSEYGLKTQVNCCACKRVQKSTIYMQILYPWFIIPNSAATFICEPGVPTITAPRRTPFSMVPDLFWDTGHK